MSVKHFRYPAAEPRYGASPAQQVLADVMALLAMIPSVPENGRYTIKLKLAILHAIDSGALAPEHAINRFSLSHQELAEWLDRRARGAFQTPRRRQPVQSLKHGRAKRYGRRMAA